MIQKTIAEIANIFRGVSYKKEQASKARQNDYIPILRANNIENGQINQNELVFVPRNLVSSSQMINKGDIIITMSSGSKAHVGKVAIANEDMDCAYGAFCAKISSFDILPKYLFYILMSSAFRKHIETQCKGTNINNIKQSYILDYIVNIPPKFQQQQIVNRIEESLSLLDSAVETLKKTKQQLEIYRQAVMKECFSECNQKVKIQSVCSHVSDGDHMPPPKSEKGIPFIMISNITDNHIDWKNTAYVGEEYFLNIGDKRRPQKGDVLYTVTGSFGIPVMVDFEKQFCFQRHIALLRPNNRILQNFLFYALQDNSVYSQANDKATGTAQKTVGLTVLRQIEIPFVESLEKQKEITNRVESQLSLCDTVEQTVNQSLQQAEALRKSILIQAFGMMD